MDSRVQVVRNVTIVAGVLWLAWYSRVRLFGIIHGTIYWFIRRIATACFHWLFNLTSSMGIGIQHHIVVTAAIQGAKYWFDVSLPRSGWNGWLLYQYSWVVGYRTVEAFNRTRIGGQVFQGLVWTFRMALNAVFMGIIVVLTLTVGVGWSFAVLAWMSGLRVFMYVRFLVTLAKLDKEKPRVEGIAQKLGSLIYMISTTLTYSAIRLVKTNANGPKHTHSYAEVLADDEIRLLELLPAKEQDQGVLQGRLVVAKLHALPQFTALSYCWNENGQNANHFDITPGTMPKTDNPIDAIGQMHYKVMSFEAPTLFINIKSQGTIRITRSLYDGLGRIQARNHGTSTMLWIDQICINQQDLAEKAVQVSLMKEIYTRAESVLIWLGDDDYSNQGRLGISFAETLSQILQQEQKSLNFGDMDITHTIFMPYTDTIPQVHNHLAEYAALAKLVGRQWFARSWIVQEVAANANKTVLCGTSEIEFTKLANALLYCIKFTDGIFAATLDVNPESKNNAKTFQAMAQSASTVSRLLDIMERHRHCKATLASDKVFAFLNISSDHALLDIRIDYTSCAKSVYLNTAKSILRHYNDLDILSFAGTLPDSAAFVSEITHSGHTKGCPSTCTVPDLPSWVPDWSRSNAFPSFRSKNQYDQYIGNYSASGTSSKSYHFDPSNANRLGVRGTFISRIRDTGPLFIDQAGGVGRYYRAIKAWHKLYKTTLKDGKYTYTDQEANTAFCDLLTCGGKDVAISVSQHASFIATPDSSNTDGKSPHDRIIEYFGNEPFTPQLNVWWRVFRMAGIMQAIAPSVANNFLAYTVVYFFMTMVDTLANIVLALCNHPTQGATVSLGFRQRLTECMDGRKMVVTDAGHVGLAPDQVKDGDVVALLAGAKVPVVLRKKDDSTWTVVADAYIHGIMFGEAWTDNADTIWLE